MRRRNRLASIGLAVFISLLAASLTGILGSAVNSSAAGSHSTGPSPGSPLMPRDSTGTLEDESVTFSESGIGSSPISWSVTIGSDTQSAGSDDVIEFDEPADSLVDYSFTCDICGDYSPGTGSVSLGSNPVNITVQFASVEFIPVVVVYGSYAALFPGDDLNVTFNGTNEESDNEFGIDYFAAPFEDVNDGDYPYSFDVWDGYQLRTGVITDGYPPYGGVPCISSSSGGIDWKAGDASFPGIWIAYACFEEEFNVTFEQTDESQLPVNDSWSVDLGGSVGIAPSGNDDVTFTNETNATYPFEVVPQPGYGAVTNGSDVVPSGVNFGNVTVWGDDEFVNVTFLPYVYGVLFTEEGLPQATVGLLNETLFPWSVTLVNETSDIGSTVTWTATETLFGEPNGTYDFTVGEIPGWVADPDTGTVSVSGSSVAVVIQFTPFTYRLNFSETGLPTGTNWFASVNGATEQSSGSSFIGFDLPNGTYSYEMIPPTGYSATPTTGTVLIDGANVTLFVSIETGFEGPVVAATAALLGVYDARPDLQAAFPNALTDSVSGVGLLNWAGAVVTGQTQDSSYSTLAPFGFWYALMATFNSRTDLEDAFGNVYANFNDFMDLVTWAGQVVTLTVSDSAQQTLEPYGWWYALMMTYNGRSDLQAAFPQAYTNYTNYTELVNWAGNVVNDSFVDSAAATLSPFGYYYDLMNVYDGRSDLQSAFPEAFTSWSSEQQLIAWSGSVVNGTFTDSSNSTLQRYGYWYALFGAVYEHRADLQTAYPAALTGGGSYRAMFGWATDVVLGDFVDSAYATLLPFASTYESYIYT